MPGRRKFFIDVLKGAGAATVGGVVWSGLIGGKKAYPLVLRPPGSIPENDFLAKCIKCGVCWVFCPDAAIYKNEEGFFLANLDYCKGCGICARECWTGCIKMVEEEK